MKSDNIKSGIEKAPHRSLLKAIGLTDEEIAQPFIGIVNSANEIVPGHIHLNQIAAAAKAGVRMAGGTPLEFPVIGICDGLAMHHEGMNYSLPSREFIADTIEIMVRAHAFDGLVFIPNCDKIIPGMLMACLRLNIPSVFVSGGPMLAGVLNGKSVDLITVFEGVGRVKAGTMAPHELKELEDCACPTCGSCSGMFTANSMNCLTEALGMGLPGNGTIPAVYSERIRLAKKAGMAVMHLLENDIKPQDIANSGDSQNGNKDEVVGYNAIAISEKKLEDNGKDFDANKISFTEKEKNQLFEIARNSIKTMLFEEKEYETDKKNFPAIFSVPMGAFVTLKIDGSLRGCIGRFISSAPLYEVVQASALSSAFEDPRFPPLTKDEFKKMFNFNH